jgi:hypothetical protein
MTNKMIKEEFVMQERFAQGAKGFCRRPTVGKGATDGAVRQKPRPGMSKQEVCEWRVIHVRLIL